MNSSKADIKLTGSTNKIAANAGAALLLVASCCLTYLVLEFFAFGLILQNLPLKTHWHLDEEIRILAQSSKSSLIPRNYVALVGDSFAEGQGDWFLEADKNGRPDFYSGHAIHNQTGLDLVSFGASGSGSLRGLVAEPTLRYGALESTARFAVSPPAAIVIYFYEGNDLNDNLLDLELRFNPSYDQARLNEAGYFDQFIVDIIEGQDALTARNHSPSVLDKLYLGRFFLELARDLARKFRYGVTKLEDTLQSGQQDWPPGQTNLATIDGKLQALPDQLQSPAMELSDSEIDRALHVFERALIRLKNNFPESRLGLVYIPSVLSSYDIASRRVSIQTYHDRSDDYETRTMTQRSQRLFDLVTGIAAKNNVASHDARPELGKASAQQAIHGPHDWKHLNQAGQNALARAVVQLLSKMKVYGSNTNGENS